MTIELGHFFVELKFIDFSIFKYFPIESFIIVENEIFHTYILRERIKMFPLICNKTVVQPANVLILIQSIFY